MHALPEKETRQTDFAARSNNQIGIGQIRRIERAADCLGRDPLDSRQPAMTLLPLLCASRKLRTAWTISSRPPYATAIVSVIASYCAAAASAELIAAGSDTGRMPSFPMACNRTRFLCMNGCTASAATLASMAAKIPETSIGGRLTFSVENTQSVTAGMPSSAFEDIVKLVGAALVNPKRIVEATLTTVASVPVEDNTDVARHRPRFDLAAQPTFVKPIQSIQEQRPDVARGRYLPLCRFLTIIGSGKS
jgi:hypothetical protein